MPAYFVIPSQDSIVEAFCEWHLRHCDAKPNIIGQPDKSDRQHPAIDYVLKIPIGGHSTAPELAVEVSSIFADEQAGARDSELCELATQIDRGFSDRRLPGPLLIMEPNRRRIKRESLISALVQWIEENPHCSDSAPSRILRTDLASVPCWIGWCGGNVRAPQLARVAFEVDERKTRDFCARILDQKLGKLDKHRGHRETWLVLYNAAWTLCGNDSISQILLDLTSTRPDRPDHLLLLTGNPPADAPGELLW